MEQQRKCPGCDGTLIDGDFIIKYDVNREAGLGDIQVCARLSSQCSSIFFFLPWFVHYPGMVCYVYYAHPQVVNGYFVHFFAPPDLPSVPKNLVFVIDQSGSMSGLKIQQVGDQPLFSFFTNAAFLTILSILQTREAMVAILQQLHEEDYFDIILFGSVNVFWKNRPVKATTENLSKALEYVKQIDIAGGSKDNSDSMINFLCVVPSYAASSGWVCFFPSRNQH